MRVLVIGGSCLLGKALYNTKPEGVELTSTYWTTWADHCAHQLDVCSKSQVSYVLGRVQPDIIIHLAAVGSVDWVQNHYLEAKAIIVDGLANVLQAAGGAKVIYTSTNAVFAGDDPPYKEDSPRHPVNVYGKIRLAAEDLLMAYRGPKLLTRLFLLYGWPPPGARGNWITTVLSKLRANMVVKAVTDKQYMPTYAPDCARAIWELLDQTGVYHIAGPERCTFFTMAQETATVWKLDDTLIQPVESSEFSFLAPRPDDTCYDISKMLDAGICPSGLRKGLKKMKEAE